MEKIADNYYRIKEEGFPSEGVKVDMTIEKIDGEYLDTHVELSGRFCVAGSARKEFIEKLGALIDEFRI